MCSNLLVSLPEMIDQGQLMYAACVAVFLSVVQELINYYKTIYVLLMMKNLLL
jgi:hypothetical protein